MSRVIKFRAWDRVLERMLIPKFIGNGNNFCSDDLMAVTGVIELLQYTGLKDKNGKEIYEGDIIGSNMNGQRQCHEVRWVDESAKWSMYWYDDPEIIGNIYENPELLERI